MTTRPKQNRRKGLLQKLQSVKGFILALLIHAVAFFVLFISIGSDESITPEQNDAEPNVVNAVVIDQSEINKEVERLKKEEEAKHKAQEDRKKEAERKRLEEEKRLEELKREQAEIEKQRQQEEQRQLEIKRQEEAKKEAERQAKIEEEKKKAEEAERLRKEQEAEEARKAEEERKRKEAEEKKRAEEEARKEAERKKAEEAERARKAEEERLAKELADQLAAEEANRVASSYYGKIAAQVERNFNIRGFTPGLECVLEIRMVPGGDVVGARVIKSSGDERFDRAAEIAVKKASPLPVPDDKKIFDTKFRKINFRFKPE